MSHVVEPLDRPSTYKDRTIRDTEASKAAREALKNSSTLYVGNLSFYTTEAQIYEREWSGRGLST
jgi:nuclear cap-binding protein subunit 2